MTRSRLLCALALMTVTACYPKAAPPPTEVSAAQVTLAQAADPAVTPELLERGRQTFVAKCGDCHKHPDLTVIKQSKWPHIMEEMTEEAELKGDAAAEVTTFVRTAAAAANAPQ